MQYLSQLASSMRFGLVGALLLASVTAAAFAQAPKLDVVYVPTPQEVVDRMLEMARLTKDDFLIDLGSGDGRIPVTAAKKYGARAFGVDINPQRVEEGRANARREGVEDKVEFLVQDLYKTDISKADVLSMYLLSSINLNLRPTILEKLRPGTRVVSHAFDMGDWNPDERDTVGYRRVFLWIVPARVEGSWKLSAGDQSASLRLKQRYQEISGEASMDGKAQDLAEARLRGTEISFIVTIDGERRTLVGTVTGDAIEGDAAKSGGLAWKAVRA